MASPTPRGLRDRLVTRRVARRMTSPVATLTAGAAASVLIAAGAPLALAGAAGVAAWSAVVATAIGRRAAAPGVDPSQLSEPWAGFVREALDAQARFDRAVETVGAGLVRDRLTAISARIGDGVQECFSIASRGAALDAAATNLEGPDTLRARMRALPPAAVADPATEATRDSLQAQIDAAERIAATRREVGDKLRVLDARLDESVARAVELAIGADTLDVAAAGSLSSTVEQVVGEMEALRAALEETAGITTTG